MKKILFLAVLASIALTGCGTANRVVDAGGAANDHALVAAQFAICNGASVGSIRRNFGSPEKAEIWRELCNSADDFTPTLETK